MNFTPNLPDLEAIVASLLAEGKCACHIINPHKTRILMWKKSENETTTYQLRIGIQKFSSQEQLDRNGEIYWRYYAYELKKEEKEPTNLDPITKFNQSHTKEIKNEPAANQQSN